MRTGNPTQTENFEAGEALAAFRFVKFDTDGTVIYTTGANEDAIGVTRYAAASGARVDIAMCAGGGTMVLNVDGNASNITYGDELTSHSATGQGQKSGTTAATKYLIRAKALAAATADDTEILVQLVHYTKTEPA